MSAKPIFAFMYDFDRTLSPRDMQEYGFIKGIGMEPGEFWEKCNSTMLENNMDQILAYMFVMCDRARGKMLLTRNVLNAMGKDVQLFKGVDTWFSRINDFVRSCGMEPEHYIISSGLKEIIEGTAVAKEFKRIYAAEFCYDDHGVPCWPAMAVNYTSKTQFIYRINKGVLEVTDNNGLNESMPEDKRRVPFRNMLYIGDGITDVPCMKIVRMNGGHSVAVYQKDRRAVNELILDKRVDFAVKADYSQGSELERAVQAIISQAAATNATMKLHLDSLDRAEKNFEKG